VITMMLVTAFLQMKLKCNLQHVVLFQNNGACLLNYRIHTYIRKYMNIHIHTYTHTWTEARWRMMQTRVLKVLSNVY